uniref:Uncharacterized protein n=1 Tax=Prymnesium polylepis TaxID=72548 RepID=A0A6V4VIV0_9EUKA|mmetsp:Transcript_46289/g.128678  ORF Transcript_46289/g.128678 Transcript_46289/m.128678 type:complete len:146 (-) Transcript_46289:398-835(-)
MASKRKEVVSAAKEPPKKVPKDDEPRPAHLQHVYLVTLVESNPYERARSQTVGMYSTKELAISNARAAFEAHSNGFFRNGKFTEPDIFEQTVDNSKKMGNQGVVFMQRDMEGDEVRVSLEQVALDKAYRKDGGGTADSSSFAYEV